MPTLTDKEAEKEIAEAHPQPQLQLFDGARSKSGKGGRKAHNARSGLPVKRAIAPPDDGTVVKEFSRPKFAGGILALHPKTPEALWKSAIERRRPLEVYVSLAGDNVEKSLEFAHEVRNHLLRLFRMADPVIVGPVDWRVLQKHQVQIDALGLGFTELGQDAYIKQSIAADRATRRHRSRLGRTM